MIVSELSYGATHSTLNPPVASSMKVVGTAGLFGKVLAFIVIIAEKGPQPQ